VQQVLAFLLGYYHSFPLAPEKEYPCLMHQSPCRCPAVVLQYPRTHAGRSRQRWALASLWMSLFSETSSRQRREVIEAAPAEFLLSAWRGEGSRGIEYHDGLKGTDHSQVKASNHYLSKRKVLLTGTRRFRQGKHDPRYRTNAAFALAVGVKRFLWRVLTFLPL
jgi:hypothetical protein